MEDKTRSLAFLSLLCFGLADVRDGLGPFLGVYLQGHGWTADKIGIIMSLGDAMALLCAAPLGALTDHTRAKRAILAAAAVLITLACGALFLSAAPLAVGVSRCVQAVAGAAVGPLIAGVTLGLVGQDGLPSRLGVNEAWNHAGNAASAALSGLVGWYYGIVGVFWVMAAMAALSLAAVLGINGRQIDHQVARGLDVDASRPLLASRLAVRRGYGALFLLALCVLPVRGLVAGLYASEWVLLPVQILDGVGNGTLGVAMPGLVARLLRGSGHINLGLGFVMVAHGIGAAMSHAYAGYIAHLFSYETAFFALALAPCVGLVLYIVSLRRFPDLHRASQGEGHRA